MTFIFYNIAAVLPLHHISIVARGGLEPPTPTSIWYAIRLQYEPRIMIHFFAFVL